MYSIYLEHGFPTQLFEPFTDEDGNLSSRPVLCDGQPVQCREAVERRDRMIEHLASLAPVQGALDQIVQRFGTDMVAEVTGRSRRIVRKRGTDGDRPPCGRSPRRIGQSGRGAGLHGRLEAHSGVLGRRRHRAQLPCRPRGEEPAAAGALSAGGRLEGRYRHPGSWPFQPHQPGAAAAVPADRDRRQGREAVPRPRSPAGSIPLGRSPRGSARPAARGCSAPTTIWNPSMAARRCASSMC